MNFIHSYKKLLNIGIEFEQAFVRLIACLVCIAYSKIAYSNGLIDPAILNIFYATIPACFLFGIWSFYKRELNDFRINLATLTGVVTATYAIALSNEAGAPFIVIYFWMILGNGLRFGSTYLFINALLAIIGFITVIQVSPYWSNHLIASYSILFSMFILPLYINILQKRLELAVKEAKEANNAKSLFLANMSHEIRTPLNGVIGMSEMLETTTLDREQNDYVKTIQSSARTLLTLIDDILDISKIEAGKTEIKSSKFSLYHLLNSITETMQQLANKKGLNFRVHISPAVSNHIIGDEKLLHQILINLIGNAIKFTKIGVIDLNVTCVNEKTENSRLRFEVKDTGIGISEAAQQSIFDKFSQADSSISSNFGGTGLGASIAKNLVEMMGGKIGVESQLDKGSNFWFELDFNKVIDEIEPDFGEFRILLVSTYGHNHAILTSFFDEFDIQWEHAITAQEADALIQEYSHINPYNILIADRNGLGDTLNGFINKIKDDNKLKDVSLILLDNDKDQPFDISNSWFISSILPPIDRESIQNLLLVAKPDKKQSTSEKDIIVRTGINLKFIVGEDNITNQKVIKRYIESEGHTADIFENGELVLDALESGDYDVIILDMHMPNMDGPETIKLYKFMTPASKRIPIIVLTANATKNAENKCKELGVEAYLTKPIKREKLFDTVYSIIDLNDLKNRATYETKPKLKLVHPKPDDGKEVINISTLDNLALLGESKGFMNDLIKGFLKDSKKLINSIIISHNSSNYLDVADLAHALKGSAQSIGATELGKIAAEIYSQSLGTDYNAISTQSNSLMDIHDKTASAMNTYLENLEISALK